MIPAVFYVLKIKLGFFPVRAGLFQNCMGDYTHGQGHISRLGGAHTHAAHTAYALSFVSLHSLGIYRSGRAILVAYAAAYALLGGLGVKREIVCLLLSIIGVAGHSEG